jgi:hypothetical protein
MNAIYLLEIIKEKHGHEELSMLSMSIQGIQANGD